jgi:5-formaminoimidazole-4-carboxamide-1-beta-D-ribofuranosyl 5'-monophosphate synthetase
LLGFFFVSFLASLDLAILSSLNESCHRRQPNLADENIIVVPQGSIVKWVASGVRGSGHVRPRNRVFGDSLRYEILVM